jgi:hypothetical protein
MRNRKLGLLLALALCALGLFAAPALAAPTLEVNLSNEPTTLPRTDEGEYYTATVKNTAGVNIEVGDSLTCAATPEDGVEWSGDPVPSFEIEWLRNGVPIPGTKGPATTAKHYTVVAEDEGKSLQCLATATNDPDGAGSAFAPMSSSFVSLPPMVVSPAPAQGPPSGSSRPSAPSGALATPKGTATTTAGSNLLTNVITTKGTGDLKAGSTVVENVTTTLGTFSTGINMQTIVASGLPEDTRITAIDIFNHTLTINKAATETKTAATLSAGALPFQLYQTLVGAGIPAGAEITSTVGNQGDPPLQFTISAPATASATEVPITGISEATCSAPEGWSGNGIVWSFQWLRNGQAIPGATNSTYIGEKADTEPPSILQCEAIATDAEGRKAISIAVGRSSSPQPPLPYIPLVGTPTIKAPSATSGPVSLEVELPSGLETFVYEAKGKGWSCASQLPVGETHAKATCTRKDALSPGASYPPLLVAARLGEDAPETGIAKATVSGGGAPPASEEATYTFTEGFPFGLLAGSFEAKVLDQANNPYNKAGGHPYKGYSTFGFNVHRLPTNGIWPSGRIKDIVVDVPRGFVGNALSTPELCASVEAVMLALCPPKSIVGGIDLYITLQEPTVENIYPNHLLEVAANVPIYSLEPEFGQPAQFAFSAVSTPYTFVPELRADEGYAVSFRTAPVLTSPALYGSNINLCDFGAKLKGSGENAKFDGCRKATEAGANPVPLITNPTRCSGPPPTSKIRIDSWENPQDVKTYDFTAEQIEECEAVQFEPEAQLTPTNHQADSPTGLGVEITMPTEGLLSPTGVSQANLNTATVTFPKGMTINPATAAGLSSCSLAQIKMHSNAPDECPESSKVGTVEIDTPLIRKTLTGSVYVAKQNENPFNAPLGLYMSFSSARDGVRIKVAGKLTPDPVTGQLTSTFTENPEAPFSRLALNFTSGPRAPLINPPKCGSYAIHSEFSPWSAVNPANPTPDEIVSTDSKYKVTQGPNGSPCPTGALDPKLKAGLQNPTAGAKSPFVLSLSREDGTQRFVGLSVTNPKGLTAYLKGVATCPESALANVSGTEGAGATQIANPSCPANSQVGIAEAGSGAGPLPFYVKTGKVYLAGPYKGAPVSLAIVTPAVAGPYDLGNVLVRTPLYIDPETAQVKAVSDPIPTALHNIALDIRDIRVSLNRPGFTAAPTNCEPSAINATVAGAEGASATVSNRFQVGGCENLAFKPKLAFHLFGGTHRGSHPRLRATVNYPPGPGYANIASTSVALPHSEFLDQANIQTVCTRVQFAAKACPAGSIYGEAEATSPLVDYALKGPVYLRSSSHELPDMVVALRGPDSQPIEIDLDGRIDSIHGGIRATFESVPDQPVSSFTLNMKGGKKGLLVNSRDICSSTQKATAVFGAQNGKSATLRPKMQNACSKARKGKKSKSKHRKQAAHHHPRARTP